MSNPAPAIASQDLEEVVQFLGDFAVLGGKIAHDGLSVASLHDIINAASDPANLADAHAAFDGITNIPAEAKTYTLADYERIIQKLIVQAARVKASLPLASQPAS